MDTMAKAAAAFGVERLVLLSTDKAVDPISIMGASKRLAELLVLANTSATSMAAVRLCNVLGSAGSVAPRFVQQIAHKDAVTVTHPDATRYFLSIDDTVQLLLLAVSAVKDAKLVIPRLGPPARIGDLARYLIDRMARGEDRAELVYTRLRRGDKLHESMTSSQETVRTRDEHALLLPVDSPSLQLSRLDEVLQRVRERVQQRDRAGLLEVLCDAVPEYTPDDELQQGLQRTRTNAP
jgi:FlaA1/EpsC-like NDP-sugar epimerase